MSKEFFQYHETKTTKWNSFRDFIDYANETANWLVLRNFEFLPDDFFGNDKDVDILCDDLDDFVSNMKLTKSRWGIAAYSTSINYKMVHFDLRFVGDNYYDKLWQSNMLRNKVFSEENVPHPNNEDYFYSLLYHSKIQKLSVKEIYKKRLTKLANSLEIEKFSNTHFPENSELAEILSRYMEKENYVYMRPIDINVTLNKAFFNKLPRNIRLGKTKSLPFDIYIRGYILKFLSRLLPKVVKTYLKKFKDAI